MRFYLDHDVSALCREPFEDRGHRVWTAGEAGLWGADDEHQMLYAASRNAVLVSHDVGFARIRQHNTLGQSIWLHCLQPDAPMVIDRHLADVVPILDRHPDVLVELQVAKLTLHSNWS